MTDDLIILSTAVCCSDPETVKEFGLEALPVDPALLPAALRRRASLTTRMAVTAGMQACRQAGVDPAAIPSVFASVGGEIQVTDALCRMLPDPDALLSPTQFHNSVHNTTAGYWSILTSSQAPTSAIAAIDDTFAMGLLEVHVQLLSRPGTMLLVCYDETWPQYLAPPMGSQPFSCALILSTETRQEGHFTLSPPEQIQNPVRLDSSLTSYIRSAPAAATVPLLQAIAGWHEKTAVALNIDAPQWQTWLDRL